MRYLGIALGLIMGLSACNMTTETQDKLGSETIALSTNTSVVMQTPTVAQVAAATQTQMPTNTTAQQNVALAVLPSCTVRTEWQIYTVAVGDTLGQIAQRSGTDSGTLATANCLSDPNALSVGQALRVPSMPAAPVISNPSAANLPMIGDFAGRPSLEACWASNSGTKPLVYDAIDGTPIAWLSNRVIVVSANPTWVQVDLSGGTPLAQSKGWMRVDQVSLIGACTQLTGVQLNSFEGHFYGNPSGVPNNICAVVINDATPARTYDAANGWMIGSLNGWAKWVSTQDNFYQFQVDSVATLDGPGPFYGWVDMNVTHLTNC